MTRLVIAAPYPTARAGIQAAIVDQPDLEVAGEAHDLESLRDAIDAHMPDVLIVDLVETLDQWLPALETLEREGSLPATVAIAGSPANAFVILSSANMSVLLRDATLEEIALAVRTAAAGLIALDPRIAAEFNRDEDVPGSVSPVESPVALTPRELEVLQGISRGLPNKSIAVELGISEHTVKFHVGSIFEKLGVTSRSEAIAAAARRGLLVL
jgi:DNA-binding NarL/FixJ family response regulator